MAFTSSTQTDTIVGSLDGGRKVVSTVVTVRGGTSTAATEIAINPLTRVISFIPSIISFGTMGVSTASGAITFAAGGLSGANTITFTPGTNGSQLAVFEILSVGV